MSSAVTSHPSAPPAPPAHPSLSLVRGDAGQEPSTATPGSAPADGGEPARPAMATRARAARRAPGTATRTVTPRKPAKTDIPIAMCPTCFMALPSTGICDTCG